MTRLAPALVLAGVALVGAAGAASATGHHDKPDTTHRAVCHPKEGGYVLINPAQASSHIDERTGAPKHSHDGRVDVYATNGACPPIGSPTTIPTTTPTEVPSSTTTTATPSTSASTPSTTSTTSQPTSPSPTSPTSSPSETPSATTKPATTTPTGSPTTPTTPRSTPRQTTSTESTSTTATTATSPSRVPSSTDAPPEQLAHTGFNATLIAVIGAGLLAAGIAVTRKGARREH